ncbi:MAG: alanine dehydrogenase [Betaproteobacteria bacterium]|nr:alanine dehydrogenase [Betaproteobacteria bacterium]MSQ87975.1 alanine dehydrogenase [Betaproteobacteria bacterium]
MRIGLPREIKDGEFRVALTPAGVGELVKAGHQVIVAPDAGLGVGFSDENFIREKATTGNPWDCELVVKVKELQPVEYRLLRQGQTLFSFQHFAPEPALLEAALASGATFIAFETVGQDDGSLPILAPMSAIAGRLAVQVGAWCLQKHNGGSGVLLSGVAGVPPGNIVILGAGNVGSNALAVAQGIGAMVTVVARSERRIASLRNEFPTVKFKIGLHDLTIDIAAADLVIGAVLTPGQMSPKLLSRAMLGTMRPGSALVDVGIDQGGIAETSRPSSHSAPIYIEEKVVHYCVPNLPAAVARSASLALEKAVLPFVIEFCSNSFSDSLKTGIQVKQGKVRHQFLARDTGRPFHPL